jgi:hypothetical protein
MMNLLVSRWRILRGIERDLAGSDPLLTGLFTMFTWLTHGEEMPAAEKLRAGSVRKLTWLRSAAGPNRPLEHWRTWFWTILLFAILVALPYSVTIGGTGHCAAQACARPAEQHPHDDRRYATGQAAHCLVYRYWHVRAASCPP